ncbi:MULTISPECIES: hypothetical protein [Pseudolactococcus]|uniref:WxL domain-containing protein n=1 Tax=Pseudolactococcus piscium MKFS47 TaxID=297352 RepID=A0A0D6DX83_9LACT|nr:MULTISPECIES: hypothetical protein [Lactococcus]MCJ1972044.1 hypothetical protein [Lactococcus carnosus]MCJ2000666.1 hypothetical protein [Lactococcus carnosus]CEN28347.1 Uncharacterized protein LACPI_1147 [Lactococcus piscium MKFS47]
MNKLLGLSLVATTLIAASLIADKTFADQTVQGTSATVAVNGTLGADNTNPDSKIPEGDDNWINVTVPTSTIFYNTPKDPTVKSPTYKIVNNSGRPVDVSATAFTADSENDAPSSFSLTLQTVGTTTNIATTATTNLVNAGAVNTSLDNKLITLANKDGRMTSTGTATAGDNASTFTYGGSSDTKTMTQLKYNLGLTFKSVGW